MKKIFISTFVLLFSSTISSAEVSTPDMKTPSVGGIGNFDLTIEPTEIIIIENKYIFDIGIKNETNRLLWDLKVNKTLSDFNNTNRLSAGISWKF